MCYLAVISLSPRLLCVVFFAVSALWASPPTELPGPTAIKPMPAAIQFATEHALPLEGFELASASESARPGDRVILLVTIQEGSESRQWLSDFSLAALTAREAKSKPDAGLGIFSWLLGSLQTDTGHEFRFDQSPAALTIRTFGPFGGAGKAKEANGRVLATREYLDHGMAQMCEIQTRLSTAGLKNPNVAYVSHPNYSDQQIVATKQRALAANFTEEDERAFAKGYLALVQFGALAFKTPGTTAFMEEIFDRPTLFSGAYIYPDWSKLQLQDGAGWGLPPSRVFAVPYAFLSKTQARGLLFITAPQPPLQNVAGIVGLTVDWSSKAPGKRLIVRVLASRRGNP